MHFYLAQINPERIQANGNTEAALFVSKLQDEWASVLHRYENGEVVQKQTQDNERSLNSLMTMREKAIGVEKQRFTHLINEKINSLGAPQVEEPQGKLI